MSETTRCDKTSSMRSDGTGIPEVTELARPLTYLRRVWRRKWLSLAVMAVVMGAGVLFTYLQKPVYEATALLAFSERSPGPFRVESSERVTQDYVNAQISLMTRDAALGEIARDPDLALSRSPMFQGETDLVEAIKDRIKILPLKDTTILSISAEGQDPKLVTAIANKLADFQRTSAEDSRDAGTRSAVQEYVGKMADLSSEMSAISLNIWSRANGARIPGLSFNEQEKDSRAIVAAFQDQHAALLAQRADARKQLDQSTAELISAETQFEAECGFLLSEAGPEAKPAAGNEASPNPAAENKPMITAAQFAALYQQLLKLEAEAEKTAPSAQEQAPGNLRMAELEKKHAEIMAKIENLRRQFQVQSQPADEQKIQQLEKSVVSVRALRMSRKIYRENYDAIQAALEALSGPLNEILNASEKYKQLEQAYLKIDEWIRAMKLSTNGITVAVYPATEPTIPIRPKWPRNMAFACLLGLMAGVGVMMLLAVGRNTMKTPNDVKRNPLSRALLGVVPHLRALYFGDDALSLTCAKDPDEE